MKRVHKTMITIQTLHNDIVGLLYDIKELLTTYHGNLIALCVGIAVAVFNWRSPHLMLTLPQMTTLASTFPTF